MLEGEFLKSSTRRANPTYRLRTILSGLLSLRINDVSIEKKGELERALVSSLPIVFSKITGEKQARAIRNTVRSFNSKHSAHFQTKYYREAGIATVNLSGSGSKTRQRRSGRVAIISAGTSDIAALNETEIILRILGCDVLRFNDLGVAGLHRLAGPMKEIVVFDPDVIVVAAGMEGALPSVVAGLSSVPVIGLPTSVGYGFGGRGEASLMSMLQACPLGIAVVNIDAGLAAGVYAYLIAKRAEDARNTSLEGKT